MAAKFLPKSNLCLVGNCIPVLQMLHSILFMRSIVKSKGLNIIKVECGSQFSVALSSNGSVYTWGKGDYHRLGHGVDEHVRRPKKVMSLQGKKIVSISTGKRRTI